MALPVTDASEEAVIQSGSTPGAVITSRVHAALQEIGPADGPLTDGGADWLPILLSGALGSIIGAVVSIAIALYVIRRQVSHERSLAREERRINACLQLLTVTQDVAGIRQSLIDELEGSNPDMPEKFRKLVNTLNNREQYGLALAAAIGDPVLRNYQGLNLTSNRLWLYLDEPADEEVWTLVIYLEEVVDDVGGAIRDYLMSHFSDSDSPAHGGQSLHGDRS